MIRDARHAALRRPAPARSVTVVIAAWRAAATIGRAVASALAQPEAAEVVVVDDASGTMARRWRPRARPTMAPDG